MKMTKLMSTLLVVMMIAIVTAGCEKQAPQQKDSQAQGKFSTNITDSKTLADVMRRLTEEKKMSLVGASVSLDENNKEWQSKSLFIVENKNGNQGNFKAGYDFRYQAVYVDYKDTGKEDAWVLMNINTGEIAEIYHEKKSGDTALIYLKD